MKNLRDRDSHYSSQDDFIHSFKSANNDYNA